MPFFKQLRRRSKASFGKNPSHSVEEVSGKSSSTIDTSSSVTPPSSIKPTLSTPSLPALNESESAAASTTLAPLRPPLANSNRNSVIVCRHTAWREPGADISNRAAAPHRSMACIGHSPPFRLTLRELSPYPIIHGYVLMSTHWREKERDRETETPRAWPFQSHVLTV